MIRLNVPPPELAWKPPGTPQFEQPVNVKLTALRYDDGTEATDADAQKVGAYIYRYGAAGEQLWNEAEQRWTTPLADPGALPPLALSYKAGDPFPWQGMLVANGLKDKDGQPRFAKASGGEPRYRLRAYARFKRGSAEYAGLSTASPELAFVSAKDSQRFAVVMDPEDPQQTTEVTLVLKNASLAVAGYLKISASGGQSIELASCDAGGTPLAVVTLAADGSIHLKPAAGKTIVLDGNLQAQRISYLRWSDGAARNLDW